jgi:MFS transporter, YNFM family, putative membrane transport protein
MVSPATREAAASGAFLERGSRAYWRASLALLFAGYATFSLLYCVQPLLPAFSASFGTSPAQSSLAISLTTGVLAFAIFAAGFVSEGVSRHRLMTASLTASSVLTIGVACVPHWSQLLALRALEGAALGGVPAVAMAYLAEEVHPDGLGLAMGLYVGGTAIGGMAGRVIAGALADLFTWRISIAVIGVLGLLSMLAFRALLPPSRHFVPHRGLGFAHHRAAFAAHFAEPGLRVLIAMAFVLMGSFVTLYNYQRLGRSARATCERASRRALPARLLPRFELRRLVRRALFQRLRVARRGRPRYRAVVRGARWGAPAALARTRGPGIRARAGR